MTRLLPLILTLLLALPATAQLPTDRHPIGVYWPDLPKIDGWVKDYGANILIFTSRQTHGGTWIDLHEKIVPNLRAEGYSVGVIRPPAFILGLPADIDTKYRDQIIAFALPDEAEDKETADDGRKLNMPRDAVLIQAKLLARIKQCRDYRPDIPLYLNFNGNHLLGTLRPEVEAMYRSICEAVDIVCMDNWQGTAAQIRNPDGSLRYAITNRLEAWKKLRALTPANKRVLGFVDTCDQNLKLYRLDSNGNETLIPAARGYPAGTRYVPSRAPTPGEVRLQDEWFREGIVYFAIQPDDRRGSVIAPELEPVLREISERRNDPEKIALRNRVADLERRQQEAVKVLSN